MESLYPVFLVIHTLCAIIFLGFIFCDVVLLTPIRKVLGDKIADRVWEVILKRGTKIMPLCVLLLVISGGAMMTRWIGVEKGFFDTSLQTLLSIKIILALLIVAMVVVSLSFKFIFTKYKNPLADIIHPAALILGFFIVVLAKIAFHI